MNAKTILTPAEWRAFREIHDAVCKRTMETYRTTLAAFERGENSEEGAQAAYQDMQRAHDARTVWMAENSPE